LWFLRRNGEEGGVVRSGLADAIGGGKAEIEGGAVNVSRLVCRFSQAAGCEISILNSGSAFIDSEPRP
jgi:hypothetical protein